MQGINPFPATQRGTEEAKPKEETQSRKDARTQREEKRKEKREKIGREMSKVEQGRHPRCSPLATRLKNHPEPTNDSSRTPHPLSHTPFPTPPFPHPLSYPTLPYPTLPYPTLLHLPFAPLRPCAFAFNSSLCVLAPLRLCVQFFPLRLCAFAFNSSLCVLAPLRLCVQFFPLRLCVQFLPFASLRLTSNLSSSSKSVSTCRYLLSIGRAAITASTSPSCNLRNKFAVVSSWTTTFALGNCEPMASGFRSLTW